MRLLAFLLALVLPGHAGEIFFQPHDVIAIIGGEDMVAMSEGGFLEIELQAALPDYQLKFRSLAWEGDTVFEQRRDLNYPTLEAQLDKMGATVIIAQFGQMESLAGKENAPAFIAAYEKLIDRLSKPAAKPETARRWILLGPTQFLGPSDPADSRTETLSLYEAQILEMARKRKIVGAPGDFARSAGGWVYRDEIHLNEGGLGALANRIVAYTVPEDRRPGVNTATSVFGAKVVAKNRLWFHYTRPQNWAFLAGDRTNQPSSRDHVDKNKRWFPEEMEQFVPLIEAKEKEIWAEAAKVKGGAK